MTAPLSDEIKKQMVEWYLEEDARTCLDLAWEFKVAQSTASKIVKNARVGKSRFRNGAKNKLAANGSSKPSSNIRIVNGPRQFTGHRRHRSF